jgi:hypothetical protein
MDLQSAIRAFSTAERRAKALGIQAFVDSLKPLLEFQRIGTDFEVHNADDIHLFFRLTNSPKHAVHIQFYPGMSTDADLGLNGRVMEIAKIIAIRQAGRASPGNEHDAVVCELPSLRSGASHSWITKELILKLVADLKACKLA